MQQLQRSSKRGCAERTRQLRRVAVRGAGGHRAASSVHARSVARPRVGLAARAAIHPTRSGRPQSSAPCSTPRQERGTASDVSAGHSMRPHQHTCVRELAYWTECASPSVRVHARVRGSMLVNRAVGRQVHLHSAVVLECERGRWLDGMCRSARSGASCCFSPSLFLFRQSPGRR